MRALRFERCGIRLGVGPRRLLIYGVVKALPHSAGLGGRLLGCSASSKSQGDRASVRWCIAWRRKALEVKKPLRALDAPVGASLKCRLLLCD